MSRAPRLWVIDPSLHCPEDEGVGEIVRGWSGESRVFRPALRPGDGPGPADGWDVDAVVLMGSAASVHDRLPWLDALRAWLTPLLDGRRAVPVLGICFGHQLVAQMAGAPVRFRTPDREKLLGIETTRLAGSRLFAGRHRLKVVVSHREEVAGTPEGYRVSARRSSTAIDGLEHERLPIFSYQFHPEARGEFALRAGLDPTCVDDRVRGDGNRLLGAFRELATGQQPAQEPPVPPGVVRGG